MKIKIYESYIRKELVQRLKFQYYGYIINIDIIFINVVTIIKAKIVLNLKLNHLHILSAVREREYTANFRGYPMHKELQ